MRLKPKQAQAVAAVIRRNVGTAIELESFGSVVQLKAGKKRFVVGAGGKVTEE